MKNILVPTDFSACAAQACDAAYLFARRFGARLHLLTSLDLPPYWDNLPAEEKTRWVSVQDGIKHAGMALEDLRQKYKGVPVTISAVSASLPDAVDQYIKRNGIDLVLIGSHGTSGKNEFFLGSNTQKVIRQVHCPVIVVKQPVEKLDFSKVIFASSFHLSEMDAFLYFKDLIKHFVPEIHLVSIRKSIFDNAIAQQKAAMKPFEEACYPLLCQSHIGTSFSVDAGIRALADQIGADLIAISYHQRHPLKRLLSGSNVEALVNHATRPVLTIDY